MTGAETNGVVLKQRKKKTIFSTLCHIMANIHSYTSDDKMEDFFYTDSPLCETAAVGRVTLL